MEYLALGDRTCKYIRIPSVRSCFDDDADTVVQVRSSTDKGSLYLIETMDPDILFFVLETAALDPSVFERFDQKQKFEGELWVPAFSTYNTLASMKDVNVTSIATPSDA